MRRGPWFSAGSQAYQKVKNVPKVVWDPSGGCSQPCWYVWDKKRTTAHCSPQDTGSSHCCFVGAVAHKHVWLISIAFYPQKWIEKKQVLGQLENRSAYFSNENCLEDDRYQVNQHRAASQTPQVVSLLKLCQPFYMKLLCMCRFPPSSRELWTSITRLNSQNKPSLAWYASYCREVWLPQQKEGITFFQKPLLTEKNSQTI